jgi:molybdate transport system permease protein
VTDPAFLEALRLSFTLALTSSLVLLVLGLPLAWVLARKRFSGRRLLEALVLLPLTLPPTVLGFYLLLLLGHGGPLATYLGVRWAFRFEGLVVGSVLFSLPFALTAYREAFRALETELLEVARLFGANRVQLWRFVVLPLARPGILSGTVLAFAHTLGEFGVILMIGGSIPGQTRTVSIYIYDLVQSLQFERAAAAAGVMLVISFVLVYVVRLLEAEGVR